MFHQGFLESVRQNKRGVWTAGSPEQTGLCSPGHPNCNTMCWCKWWLHPHHHRETILGVHGLLVYHKWQESFFSPKKTAPKLHPKNPIPKRERLFFFLAFSDFITPEALDDILVTAVTPDQEEMAARPTAVLCWALSVGGGICYTQLWQWLVSDGTLDSDCDSAH